MRRTRFQQGSLQVVDRARGKKAWEYRWYELQADGSRSRFGCKKIFAVPGNHDKQIRKLTEEFSWLSNLAEISIHGQAIVICHCAMRVWNRSRHGAWHLYGHSHGNLPDTTTSLSMDVGVDTHDFRPWHFDEISTLMAERVKRRAAPEHPSQSSIHD
jgi:calcineurin-like phosphoesterase family protein